MDLIPYWLFFTTLSAHRQAGPNGPQPISMVDINALAQMRNYTRTDDLEFILMAIPAMDRIYLDKAYAEREKKAKDAAKKPPQGRRR